MEPVVDRRDIVWIQLLQREVDSTPLPPSLEAALLPLRHAAATTPPSFELLGGSFAELDAELTRTRAAWRDGGPWGVHGQASTPNYLGALGLTERTYGQTALQCEEMALSVFAYTLQRPMLFASVNSVIGNKTLREDGNAVSARLRPLLPYMKLLTTALKKLPEDFIFTPDSVNLNDCCTGRCWRGVKHLFPGYPGSAAGTSRELQTHDPEGHFPIGSRLAFYTFTSTSDEKAVTLEFLGRYGPATLFEFQVKHGYRIAQLSAFRENEVLLPLTSTFEVVGCMRMCTPQPLPPPGQPYPATFGSEDGRPLYERFSGAPDIVQLKQLDAE